MILAAEIFLLSAKLDIHGTHSKWRMKNGYMYFQLATRGDHCHLHQRTIKRTSCLANTQQRMERKFFLITYLNRRYLSHSFWVCCSEFVLFSIFVVHWIFFVYQLNSWGVLFCFHHLFICLYLFLCCHCFTHYALCKILKAPLIILSNILFYLYLFFRFE